MESERNVSRGTDVPVARLLAILLGAGLVMYVNLGPVVAYTFGVFLKPIVAETGWDRSAVAAAFGPAGLVTGLTAPFVGYLADRFGPRRVIGASTVLLAVGLVALGRFATSAGAFQVLLVLVMLLGAGLTPVPASCVVSGWFDRRRGLAIGIMLALGGVGVATLPPIAARLIAVYGWRDAYAALGLVVLALGLPSVVFLLRDPIARETTRSASVPGSTLREAARTRTFWTLFVSLFLISFAVGAGSVHLPALLADRGVPPTRAAFIMSVVGISMILGRIVAGALLDIVFAPRLAGLVFMGPMVGHALLAAGGSGWNAVVAAALFGIGLGAEVDAFTYLTSRAFGLRDFGKIYGALTVAFTTGIAGGGAAVGVWFGKFNRYDEALWAASVAAGIAGALMFTLRPEALRYGRKQTR